MKRRCVHILTALVALLLLAACGGGADRARLARAESLMDERPDSALAVLDSVDGSRLRGADRALYALLLTQARDKNFMDLGSDSLMTLAVEHYAGAGDEERLAQASYFRGRQRYRGGEYSEALPDFISSWQLSVRTGNDFLAGLSCRGISDIYGDCYSASDQIEFAQKELDYLLKSGKRQYYLSAMADVGTAYNNAGLTEKSREMARMLEDSATRARDAYHLSRAWSVRYTGFLIDENYSAALPSIRKVCESGYGRSSDSINLLLALARLGKREDAMTIMNSVRDVDSLRLSEVRGVLDLAEGNYEAALRQSEYQDSVATDLYRSISSESLGHVLSGYYELQRERDAAVASKDRLYHRSTLVGLLCVFGCAVLYGVRIYRDQRRLRREEQILTEGLKQELDRKREDLRISEDRGAAFATENADLSVKNKHLREERHALSKEKLALMEMNQHLRIETEGLRETTEKLLSENESLANQTHMLKERAKTTVELVKELDQRAREMDERANRAEERNKELNKDLWNYKERVSALNENMQVLNRNRYGLLLDIANRVYLFSGKIDSDDYSQLIREMIADFSVDGKCLQQLKIEADRVSDNAVSRLQRELPRLTKEQVAMFIYHVLGFPQEAMLTFLKLSSPSKLHDKRRRLREKVEKLPGNKPQQYIEYLKG